jgi:hypothetical protein
VNLPASSPPIINPCSTQYATASTARALVAPSRTSPRFPAPVVVVVAVARVVVVPRRRPIVARVVARVVVARVVAIRVHARAVARRRASPGVFDAVEDAERENTRAATRRFGKIGSVIVPSWVRPQWSSILGPPSVVVRRFGDAFERAPHRARRRP